MGNDYFKTECKFILKWSIILNVVIFLISLIFERSISVLLGLLLGTVILFLNLKLLNRDIQNAVNFGSNRAKLLIGYLLRYLLIGSAFYFAVQVKVINPFGVIVPLFYPRVIYTLKGIITN